MTDHQILFKGPMVRAILTGTKSQTRRVLKPQPYNADKVGVWYRMPSGGFSLNCYKIPYAVGDWLWVRESHYLTDDGHEEYAIFAEDEGSVADYIGKIAATKQRFDVSDEWVKRHLKLRPSIHMPRWASRITQIVTDVRVQRLQDISSKDAQAEGIYSADRGPVFPPWTWAKGEAHYETPQIDVSANFCCLHCKRTTCDWFTERA